MTLHALSYLLFEVTEDLHVKVADFGLSKMVTLTSASKMSMAGGVRG